MLNQAEYVCRSLLKAAQREINQMDAICGNNNVRGIRLDFTMETLTEGDFTHLLLIQLVVSLLKTNKYKPF